MSREHVGKLLKHIYERQGKHGPENAFQFRIYIGCNKERLPACYPLQNNRQEKQSPKKPRKKTNKKGKRKAVEQLDNLLQMPASNSGTPARDAIHGMADSDPSVDRLQNVEPGIPSPAQAIQHNAGRDDPIPRMADSDPSGDMLQNVEPGMPSPAQHNVPAAGPCEDDFVEIDMLQQVELAAQGIRIWPSVHGPSRGQPRYMVLRSALAMHQKVASTAGAAPNPCPQIDPALLTLDNIGEAAANDSPGEAQSRPRPRPRPVVRASTITQTPLDRSEPSARAATVIDPAPLNNSHSAGEDRDHGRQMMSTSAGPDLGRRLDSDQLALLEAQKYMTSGKRSRRVTQKG